MRQEDMINDKIKKVSVSISFIMIIFVILSPNFILSSQAYTAGKFSVEVEIDLKKLDHPDRLKVVASANGDSETKYLTGNEINSNVATVSLVLIKEMTLLLSVVEMSILYAPMQLIR